MEGPTALTDSDADDVKHVQDLSDQELGADHSSLGIDLGKWLSIKPGKGVVRLVVNAKQRQNPVGIS